MKFLLVVFLLAPLVSVSAGAADFISGTYLYQMPMTPFQRGAVYTRKIYMTAMKHSFTEDASRVFCGLGGKSQAAYEGDSFDQYTSDVPWCSGKFDSSKLLAMPDLWMPTHLTTAGQSACALDQMGVKCWHYEYAPYGIRIAFENVPDLDHPTSVTRGRGFACALARDGVHCWGDNSHGQLNVPELKHPTQVSAGVLHVCALDDEGVKCWGDNSEGQLNVPALVNTNFILAGFGVSCANDDAGFHCWGRYENLKKDDPVWDGDCQKAGRPDWNPCIDHFVRIMNDGPSTNGWPDFNLDQLSPLAEYLAAVSSQVRATYFRHLDSFLRAQLASSQRLHSLSLSRYLMVKFMAVGILSADSEYYKKTLLPGYRRSMSGIEDELGISGVEQVPDSALSRMVALQVIHSSCFTLSELLGGEDLAQLQALQRTLGQAMADPVNGQKLGALLTSLETADPLWGKVSALPKMAFLAQTIHAAAAWLKPLAK